MLDKNKTYALVGASNNNKKYGYMLLNYLKDNGFQITPINPKETKILGLTTYHKLSELKIKIDTVIFVVPPSITEKVLKEVNTLNIKNVWLQPGSESETAINYCQENDINCTHNACIMRLKKPF